jgi:hypothetical protein
VLLLAAGIGYLVLFAGEISRWVFVRPVGFVREVKVSQPRLRLPVTAAEQVPATPESDWHRSSLLFLWNWWRRGFSIAASGATGRSTRHSNEDAAA